MLAKALQLAAAGNSSVVWPDISTGTSVRSDAINCTDDVVGIFFKPDGTKIYTCEINDKIIETTLSTPWDISTHGSADHTLTTDQTNHADPRGLWFSPDGDEMYSVDGTGDVVVQYSLTTAWDLSTATYTRKFDVSTEEALPKSVCFSTDGLNMYVTGWSGDGIDRYTLTTAWDISTASHTSYSGATSEPAPTGIFMKEDGKRFFLTGQAFDKIEQFNLSTAYDTSSDVDTSPDSSLALQPTSYAPQSIYISPDGRHLYFGDTTFHGVFQYSLG